jgi:LuxR family maltose regulon positive regulatory protein
MDDQVFWPQHAIRRAKLLPPQFGQGLISRPRLVETIERSTESAVTLVVGPAGFGKTTALCEWMSCSSRPVAWLTLDGGDAQLDRFVTHFLATLESVVPAITGEIRDLFAHCDRDARSLGEAIADALYGVEDPFVLVLDDLHEVPHAGILDLVSALIQYPPPAIRLVLSARWDPQLPIARLRGRGLLNEVRAADLRFTEDETRSLLATTMSGDPDRHLVSLLHDRTEGWAAGLRLASMALREQPGKGALDATLTAGSDRHVMDFLLDEVLRRQTPEAQSFLLRTSITDRICGSLADAIMQTSVTGESEEILESVVRVNLYVEQQPVDGQIWYRYHPLFLDLLRHRLSVELSSDEIRECHQRASEWFAENQCFEEAISHALLAHNPAGAALLVERFRIDAFNLDDLAAVRNWLDMLPESIIQERPKLLLTRARLCLLRGQYAGIRSILRDVELLLDGAASPGDEENEIRAEHTLLMAMTLPLETRAARSVPEADDLTACLDPRDYYARGLAMLDYGMSVFWNRGAEEAISELHSSLVFERDSADIVPAMILISKANVFRHAGNFQEAERAAAYALEIAREHTLPFLERWARATLGYGAYCTGELAVAESLFEDVTYQRDEDHFYTGGLVLVQLAMTQQGLGKSD